MCIYKTKKIKPLNSPVRLESKSTTILNSIIRLTGLILAKIYQEIDAQDLEIWTGRGGETVPTRVTENRNGTQKALIIIIKSQNGV